MGLLVTTSGLINAPGNECRCHSLVPATGCQGPLRHIRGNVGLSLAPAGAVYLNYPTLLNGALIAAWRETHSPARSSPKTSMPPKHPERLAPKSALNALAALPTFLTARPRLDRWLYILIQSEEISWIILVLYGNQPGIVLTVRCLHPVGPFLAEIVGVNAAGRERSHGIP